MENRGRDILGLDSLVSIVYRVPRRASTGFRLPSSPLIASHMRWRDTREVELPDPSFTGLEGRTWVSVPPLTQ
jgi:hypothetical protein